MLIIPKIFTLLNNYPLVALYYKNIGEFIRHYPE